MQLADKSVPAANEIVICANQHFFFLHVEYFKCVERRVQNSIGASDIIDKSKPTQTNELVRCNADHTGTSERLGPNITGVEPSGQCKAQNKHISWSIASQPINNELNGSLFGG